MASYLRRAQQRSVCLFKFYVNCSGIGISLCSLWPSVGDTACACSIAHGIKIRLKFFLFLSEIICIVTTVYVVESNQCYFLTHRLTRMIQFNHKFKYYNHSYFDKCGRDSIKGIKLLNETLLFFI